MNFSILYYLRIITIFVINFSKFFHSHFLFLYLSFYPYDLELSYPQTCSTYDTIGHPLTSYSESTGDHLNFLIGFKFPCDGYITAVIFLSKNLNYSFRIGIWEFISETSTHYTYYCHNKIHIPALLGGGEKIVNLTTPIRIRKGYSISFDFKLNEKHNIVSFVNNSANLASEFHAVSCYNL